MEYSPLSKVTIKNFRNIENVEIDFKDSGGIIALEGTNDSGKSSIIRALGVALDNMWYNKQSKFIRTGADGFGIRVQFADGSKIVRRKTGASNEYAAQFTNGERKVCERLTAEPPDFIKGIAGFAKDPETGACLNLRTYTDKLLFVGTTDGENYKIFQNAVNNLDVREAVRNAKADLSEITQNIIKAETAVRTLEEQRDKLRVADPQYIKMTARDLEKVLEISKVISPAVKLLTEMESLFAANRALAFEVIDETAARLLCETLKEAEKSNELRAVADMRLFETVDTQSAELINRALAELSVVSENCLCDVEPAFISIETADLLTRALQAFIGISEFKAKISEADALAEKYSGLLKDAGVSVIVCEKCGNEIVIEGGGE